MIDLSLLLTPQHSGKLAASPSNTPDYRNRLTNVYQSGSPIATYTYDALDHRIGTKISGTQSWTVYDGQSAADNPYADFDSAGALKVRYLYGLAVDAILARTDSAGTTAWYLPDRLGTIRDVANISGGVIDHIVYGSFGTVNNETSPTSGDRFKFTGREYDSTTGLYYYRARSYGPTTGRFVSLDPSGFDAEDSNLYRYVGNRPTNESDPMGLQTGPPKLTGSSDGTISAELTPGGNSDIPGYPNPIHVSPPPRFPGGPGGTPYTPGQRPSPQNSHPIRDPGGRAPDGYRPMPDRPGWYLPPMGPGRRQGPPEQYALPPLNPGPPTQPRPPKSKPINSIPPVLILPPDILYDGPIV